MTITVVVVDDEEADRYLVKRAVKGLGHDTQLIEFRAGDQFVDTIRDSQARREQIGSAPPPILVLLDINMPRKNGFDVLEEMSEIIDDEDQIFVVTMYSSSDRAKDRADAFQFSFVKDYVVKPVSTDRLEQIMADNGIL